MCSTRGKFIPICVGPRPPDWMSSCDCGYLANRLLLVDKLRDQLPSPFLVSNANGGEPRLPSMVGKAAKSPWHIPRRFKCVIKSFTTVRGFSCSIGLLDDFLESSAQIFLFLSKARTSKSTDSTLVLFPRILSPLSSYLQHWSMHKSSVFYLTALLKFHRVTCRPCR